jgi:hypothetical protein
VRLGASSSTQFTFVSPRFNNCYPLYFRLIERPKYLSALRAWVWPIALIVEGFHLPAFLREKHNGVRTSTDSVLKTAFLR